MVGAADVDSTFVLDDVGPAFRAGLWEAESAFRSVAAMLFDADDSRDDLASLFDDDGVSDAKPESF